MTTPAAGATPFAAPPVSRTTIVTRTQVPFVMVLAVVLVLGTSIDVGPTWSYAVSALLAALSLTITALTWPRGGQTALIVSAVLQIVAVAVSNYALWELAPSMSGLMLLPALHLAYGFQGRRAPYLLAVLLPPVLSLSALRLGGAPDTTLLGSSLQNVALVVVTTVVHLHARRTWRRRAILEAALVRAERSATVAQAVTDAIDTGVTYYDTDGEVLIRNRAMSRLARRAEYDTATRTARHLYQSNHETPVEAGEQPVTRMIRGDAVDRSLLYLGAPGDQRAVEFTATRLPDDGGPTGWVLTAHDVTELANAVATREEMLLTFTHELRTPLTSIIGFAELMQDTYDLNGLGLAKPVGVIHDNATHLSTLVQEILQAGSESRAELSLVRADVLAVARDTVSSFGPKATGRRVTLSLEARTPDAVALIDPPRVRQALENLVSNALKYTGAGGHTRVIVSAGQDDVAVDVVDDGPGIDPQDLPQLFQRGFRSVSARRTATQGMGLGLAIARDIARAHGGDVLVADNDGPGVTFTLRVPRVGSAAI